MHSEGKQSRIASFFSILCDKCRTRIGLTTDSCAAAAGGLCSACRTSWPHDRHLIRNTSGLVQEAEA